MAARETSAGLDALRVKVDDWRRRRGKRTRIPAELWDEAVRVAETDGLWAASKAARFHYPDLKQKFESARHGPVQALRRIASDPAEGHQANGVAHANAGSFVELPMALLGAGTKTVVELVAPCGDRMRVEAAGVDLAGLVRAFFGRDAR